MEPAGIVAENLSMHKKQQACLFSCEGQIKAESGCNVVSYDFEL